MTTRVVGPNWEPSSRNQKGHRIYRVTYTVESDSTLDGPAAALATAGLPIPGQLYQVGNDFDTWAWCRYETDIHPERQKDGNTHWYLTFTFSTEPVGRCQLLPIENPLLEPMDISGSFIKYTEEAVFDRFGNRLLNSAFQVLRGPQVEFDMNRPTVRLKWNVSDLQLDILCQMIDTLNDQPLWGMPARTIKLSNVTWERKFYGICSIYYERTLEFDVWYRYNPYFKEFRSGFDKDVADEGTKVLNGRWNPLTGNYDPLPWPGYSGTPNPNPRNPAHFIPAVDRFNNKMSLLLNGAGLPAGVTQTGTSVTMVNTTLPLGNTPSLVLTPTAQPANPAQIVLLLEDPSDALTSMKVLIVGTDQDDTPMSEIWEPSEGGIASYTTSGFYKVVTSVTITDLLIPPPTFSVVDSYGTSIVQNATLANGTATLTGSQPPVPSNLFVEVEGAVDVETGDIVITQTSPAISEGITLEPERGSYGPTLNVFTSVNSVTVSGFTSAIEAVKFTVYSSTELPAIGNRHIERYGESNMFLLGVPAAFDANVVP